MTAEDALDKIESVQIASLTADVFYTRTDPILDRREIRMGRLLFQKAKGKREVAILFDTLIIGRRRETKQKHYIFSGRWMAEVDHDKKQFIKRELVRPGQDDIDPFELGSGPIPLPIGQSKESVLKKFVVTLIEKPTEGPLEKLDDTVVGLHLIPKTNDEWEYINLFYDNETWLPMGVETIELDGTKRVSRLSNMQSGALSSEDAALLNIETPDPKEWSIDVQKLQVSPQ
jgi:hypothetical protein